MLLYARAGNLQAILDEYVHVLTESEGLASAHPEDRWEALAARLAEVTTLATAAARVAAIRVDEAGTSVATPSLRTHVAARFGGVSSSEGSERREGASRQASTSPFMPLVLASTSVGQDGLDFHTYAHAVVPWNLPSNPVDLEQREGRVHRYKGYAIRKTLRRRSDRRPSRPPARTSGKTRSGRP